MVTARSLFILLSTLCVVFNLVNAHYEVPQNRKKFECEKVNLLYTWVDGNDAVWAESRVQRLGQEYASASRFRDLNGLLYSLRSVEKFAPWVEKIFIYTANQIPGFLNTDNPKIHMLFHDDIFPNKTDLPTFNSNAIEASFPYLPDVVGPCFIYLNDDVFFARNIYDSDFYDEERGQFLHEDGWEAPASEETQEWDSWHRSIAINNGILDGYFGHARRPYTEHGPQFFNLNIIREMGETFKDHLAETMRHPVREITDTVLSFLYHHYTNYKYQSVSGGGINHWQGLFNDEERVCADLEHLFDHHPKAVCLNDQMGDTPNEKVIACSEKMFNSILPEKSSFEL